MAKIFTLKEYIENLGTSKVAELCGVNPATVNYWKTLDSVPRPETALKLIEISQGLLTWQGILEPYARAHQHEQLKFDFTK